MKISIITPSFGQLDWLRLCIASVADQVTPEAHGSWKLEAGSLEGDTNEVHGIGSKAVGEGEMVTESNVEPSSWEPARKTTVGSPEGGTACLEASAVNVEGRRSNSEGFQHFNHSSPAPSSQLPASAQSTLSIEHIIQDGGTPGIEEFAREFGETLKSQYGGEIISDLESFELLHLRTAAGYSLRVFKEPDAGMYDAINKGTAKISGEIWAWINSDEQYLPGTLVFVRDWFGSHPDADILCGDALLTDDKGEALSYRRIVSPLWRHTRLVHLASLSCASFYRRSVIRQAGGFDTTWRSIGDAEWMARMMKSGIRPKACGRLLSTFAFTGQNTSESPMAGREAALWRSAPDAPPGWQTFPVIWMHRIRKLLAGAYHRRHVHYSIFASGSIDRTAFEAGSLGWEWPSGDSRNDPGPREKQSVPVLGCVLAVTDYRDLSDSLIRGMDGPGGPIAVDFANTHVITLRRHDPDFARLAECIDITVPDGMPLVWTMNRKGAGLKDRVYGPTFTRRFLASCPAGMTHYLVGGSEECGRRFRERMQALNPTLKFVGSYHGKCSSEGVLREDEAVLADIQEKKPDFIWVGLGTPKQYGWISRIKPMLDHGVLLAVGFALDVNAGTKPDAPRWMQGIGLTWLHRMASEPRRLAGRYLKYNALFLWYCALEGVAPALRGTKRFLRAQALRVTNLFASEIRDCVTGERLGRGLLLGWGGRFHVIGFPSLPPLIPRFLPQRRLTYWKQNIGFTVSPAPDFPSLAGARHRNGGSARVMNLMVTHEGGERFRKVRERWGLVCDPDRLWVAFGGRRADFEALEHGRKVFVDDPRLRRRDNQREKQCYAGVFRAMQAAVREERPDYIYFCEYDHIPLVADLNRLQVEELEAEEADVMGHWLYRVDGTGHYHELYHEADPEFFPFWKSISRREDRGAVLSMFGSGSMWSREAFLAVGDQRQRIECYLEIYLPTLAHHLGYRVRRWREGHHLISNLPSRGISAEEGRRRGCWTVHPVKDPEPRQAGLASNVSLSR